MKQYITVTKKTSFWFVFLQLYSCYYETIYDIERKLRMTCAMLSSSKVCFYKIQQYCQIKH